MPHYLDATGPAPEASGISITDSMGVELAVLDFQLQAQDKTQSPVFGVGVGGTIVSQPKIKGGTVYFGACDKNIYAVDVQTGKEKWRFSLQDIVFDVALANDTVYAASYDRCLYAISEAGKLRWRFEAKGMITCTPLVAGGIVFIVGGDCTLYAVDEETGRVKWSIVDGMPSFGCPAVEGDTVYIGFLSGNCYAISLNGSVKWVFTAAGPTGSATIGRYIYFPSFNGKVYALNRDGSLVWAYTTGVKNLVWKPGAVGNDTVYITGADQDVYAISEGGDLRWKFPTDSLVFGTLLLSPTSLSFGSFEGMFYTIDRESGALRTKKPLGGKVICASRAGDRLFFSCYDCKLLCTDLEGNVLWSFPTSLSYVSSFNFQSIRPQTLASSQLQAGQDNQRETEAYKGKVRQEAAGGSVYSALNIGYASSFNQYTKRTKYVH